MKKLVVLIRFQIGFFFIVYFVLLFINKSAKCQDPHFSQYFSSPLTLNPAYTGFFEGPERLAFNFRNQWLGAGEPFSTGTISFEHRLLDPKINSTDNWGIGILAIYDKTARGSYNSTYVSASTGFHKQLDEDGYHHLGIGFQGSFGNRKLDFSNISFNEQFTSRGFDLNLYNGESLLNRRDSYFDFNLGLLYNYHGPRQRYYVGSSFYHVTAPSISFLGSEEYQLPMRYTLHGGASWLFGSHAELYTSAQFMKQGPSINKVAGIVYGHSLLPNDESIVLYAGLWIRMNDAIYPYLGYKWENFQFGISYDINTNGLQSNATKNKSFEISMIYEFLEKEEMKRFIPWY